MARRLRFLLVASAFALAACSNENASSAAGPDRPKGGGDPALQTTLAEPAPEGERALNVEVLAEGLVNPWCVAFLPDGTILVTERAGRLRVIRDGALVEEPVAGVPEVYAHNQAGLFDILPHPDFAENRTVFLAYAHGTDRANALRVARATFDGAALNDLEVIYEAKPMKEAGYHYGGKIVYAPDGTLWVSVGEGSRYKELAQDMTTSFGAIIRINQDGSIPEDNPDFGEDALPELWTKGHRNPQGLAWDGERGILWSNEHGPRGGDEINVIEKGANYGWPLASYGIDYNGARITPFTEYEGTRQPFKYWTPSIGVSGLAVYRGDLFPDWDGDLFVGAMATRALHRIDLDEAGNEIGEERYLLGERVRDVRVGPDGAIYVTTEDRQGAPIGQVLRLTPQ
ncbi:PQQ-dependent sugar dehydrogenase [Amphiplicatus metriothermophilus]|uniref:Glucose/arabinose dehydrogenase, beta-propeller fold n=1 Tax=Amphiplicatus metriothermophilus TaxID=1519374 RepID=A0A239PJT7_9PROT|nr:PQQ-dependent sugar dehydrogenase [Amphiplicatus metriothermophilus]MBB5517759.1 glucose/arabinose dehydrogenase [Amphiplicatus metriothermophilus]SNT67907.1 Glucose/arabinose dehydrogenase, beta-propeller fold [Amphiplicatus metriothermophilus]